MNVNFKGYLRFNNKKLSILKALKFPVSLISLAILF